MLYSDKWKPVEYNMYDCYVPYTTITRQRMVYSTVFRTFTADHKYRRKSRLSIVYIFLNYPTQKRNSQQSRKFLDRQ